MVRSQTNNGFFSPGHLCTLAVCWGVSFYALLYLTAPYNIALPAKTADAAAWTTGPDNEYGAVSLHYYNPRSPTEPDLSFRFDHLTADNARVGLFQTALCRTITLQNLSIGLYSFTDTREIAAAVDDSAALTTGIEQLSSRLSAYTGQWIRPEKNVTVTLPDLSQVIQATAHNFRFDWFCDDRTRLTVQSRIAVLSADTRGQLILKGAVQIVTPAGKVQTNHAAWDMESRQFYIQGGYVLTQNNQKQFGRNACFDVHLNVSETAEKTNQKGDPLCCVKSY
jgi:hypothetical protein